MKTEKEWAEFGKKLYDTAVNNFIDKPVNGVVIPLTTKDGDIAAVRFDRPVTFVDTVWENGERVFKHYYKLSDGSYILQSEYNAEKG